MISFRLHIVSSLLGAVLVLGAGCSTTRLLGEGEQRLDKNEIVLHGKDKDLSAKEMESYISQKPNGSGLFGFRPGLLLYNLSGKDPQKGINRLLRSLGTAPVIFSPALVTSSEENIRRHLEYLGYYGSEVKGEVTVRGKKATVRYDVIPGKRFRIGRVTYSVPEGPFTADFQADTSNISIKSGDFLSEDALEKESERSAAYFRRLGYYGFNKNFYTFEADTLSGRDTADLCMTVRTYTRNETPEDARRLEKFRIGDVLISYDRSLRFNDRLLLEMNTLRSGMLYDEQEVNNTYSRMTALKLFSGVSVELTPRDSALVDCDIRLTKSQLQGFKVNLEGSTNSSGLIGISPQLNYFHKNIFHGGQWLNLGFLGNFQFMASNRSIHSNEFGVTASVSFPEFLGLPNSLFRGPSVPRTEVAVSYNYQNRPEYTRNIISTSFGYSGNHERKFFYQFYPLQLKVVRLSNLDQNFYNTLAGNPFLRDAYQNHFDMGAGFNGYYTTCADLNPRVSYQYVRLQADLSGNLLSVFRENMRQDAYGAHLLWGTPFSQYARVELTLGKTFVFGPEGNQALATRLLGGLGYAYGNSTVMPFEKQFYSGGANSMRGWQARALGPGLARPDPSFVIPSQTGDLKLEANVEYRFPLTGKLKGVLFTDVGNIWALQYDEGEEDPPADFSLDSLPESLAANWGLGLRFDLNFLILRIDLGVKLHDPSRPAGDRWILPGDYGDAERPFALHFGVGHAF